jgi:hypothetical protein
MAAATSGLAGLLLRTGSGSSRQSSVSSNDRTSPRGSALIATEEDDDVGMLFMDLGYDLVCLMEPSVTRAAPVPESENPPLPPAQAAYTPHDFVTGLVQLNRDYCRVRLCVVCVFVYVRVEFVIVFVCFFVCSIVQGISPLLCRILCALCLPSPQPALQAGQLPSALRQKILFGSDFVVP